MDTISGEYRSEVAEWYREYHSKIRRFAKNFLRSDEATAEEVMQETFLKAFSGIENFRREASPKTWLFTIALNVCRNYYSRGSHRYDVELDEATDLDTKAEYRDGYRMLLSKQCMEQFEFIKEGMSDAHRTILMLWLETDMDYVQMAEHLNIPVGTVRSRINAARNIVKNHFQSIGIHRPNGDASIFQ